MGNTIYASFADADLAEKAAGALLDFGMKPEDLSLVRNYNESDEGAKVTNMDPETQRFEYTGTATSQGDMPPAGSAEDFAVHERAYGETAYVAGTVGAYVDPLAAPVGYVPESFVGTEPGFDPNDIDPERVAKEGLTTTTGADAAAGAAKGAGWGLGVGILAAIAALVVPGFGVVIGGGALATAIGGALATTGAGAVAGAATGYLKDQGMSEHVVASYDDALRNGGALLAVTVPSGNIGETEARQILDKYAAQNVHRHAASSYMA